MPTPEEYRQYAAECVAWAKEAATDAERETFLQMAEDWLRAAALLTAPVAPSDSGTTPRRSFPTHGFIEAASYNSGIWWGSA
jgi:hypothetical protein